jgi:hypothetical protein
VGTRLAVGAGLPEDVDPATGAGLDNRVSLGSLLHESGQTSSVSARCLIPRSILRSIGSPAASLII